MKKYLFLFLVIFSTNMYSQEKDKNSIDWLKQISSRISVNGYAQAGYTWQHKDGKDINTFDIKRTLLWAKADITDRWSFLFMHDFSSVVQEFYTDYRFSKGKELTVRVGQFKNSYSIENPLSPTKLELVNVCSQGVSYLAGCGSDPLFGIQYGRDLGMKIYGLLFNNHIYYELALMNGQGVNVKDKNNKKDVIARLDYRPTENIRIVASGQLGTGHAMASSIYNPEISIGEDYTRNRWSVGAEWKSRVNDVDYWKVRPSSIRGELLGGRDGKADSYGGYVTASIPLCKELDAIGSIDYFNYNKDLDMDQTNYTIGVQHWFHRQCRVQLQYTYSDSGYDANASLLQAQLQVAF